MTIDQQNFITYLKKEYPYLYEVKKGIENIQNNTGFGDVSFVLRVQKNRVDMIEIITAKRKLLEYKKDNIFE